MICRCTALATLAACSMDLSPAPKSERTRPVLARVDGAPVYLDDYQRLLRRVELAPGNGLPAAVVGKITQHRAALDDLIDRRLLLREAEAANVVVGMDQVDVAYARLARGWTAAEFKSQLAERGIAPAELKRDLRELQMIRKYFTDHLFARLAVRDQEIDAHIAGHPELVVEPETVHVQQIVLDNEAQAKELHREIRRRKITFEDAAIQHSVSPEGAKGGSLGYLRRGEMPLSVNGKAFDDVCFAMRVGDVSPVMSSRYGYHIVRVLDRRPEAERPAAAVREQVEQLLRRQKERRSEAAKLEELRSKASIEIEEELLASLH